MSDSHGRQLTVSIVLLLFIAGTAPAGAELQDHGPRGEYFLDTATGLYWFDPGHFHEQARITVDLLSDHSPIWSWATSAEVEALMGQTAETGSDLEDVMGPRHSTIDDDGPRWMGFHFNSGDDGWIVQSHDLPDFATVTATGAQANAYAFGAGAWLVAALDPVTANAVIEDDGIYFHDHATDLYWYDPAEFFLQTREDVEAWLGTHPDWRWATDIEIFGLLGKSTVDGQPLEQALGTRSTSHTSGGPRWIGFFVGTGIHNGLLLQSDIEPGFDILDTGSTQANAGAYNAGAWLVSETDPTGARDENWGAVKRGYE